MTGMGRSLPVALVTCDSLLPGVKQTVKAYGLLLGERQDSANNRYLIHISIPD